MITHLWRRTVGEFVYAVAGLPLGIIGFVLTVVTVSVGGGLAVTVVGLPILAVSGIVAAWLASVYRVAGNRLLPDEPVAAPRPSGRGWFAGGLRDAKVWRARLYLVLKLPLGIMSFVAAVAFYSYGLGGLTYAIWQPFLPNGGLELWNGYVVDDAGSMLVLALLGAGMLALAPLVVHASVSLDRRVVRVLLAR
jgi:hypothetical protein